MATGGNDVRALAVLAGGATLLRDVSATCVASVGRSDHWTSLRHIRWLGRQFQEQLVEAWQRAEFVTELDRLGAMPEFG